VLTEHDHVVMGERVAASLGYPKGSPQEQQIINAYLSIWHDLHLPFVPPGAAGIGQEQFLTSTTTLATNPELAQATLGGLAEAFLAIADGDGMLSHEEFVEATVEFWTSTDPAARGNAFAGILPD
jgi:hypothetical protein